MLEIAEREPKGGSVGPGSTALRRCVWDAALGAQSGRVPWLRDRVASEVGCLHLKRRHRVAVGAEEGGFHSPSGPVEMPPFTPS